MTRPDAPPPGGFAPLPAPWPFAIPLLMAPLTWVAVWLGGAWLWLPVIAAWYLVPLADAALGRNTANPDPQTPARALAPYRRLTLLWPPLQAVTLFGGIALVTAGDGPDLAQGLLAALALGVVTGTVGINFAHEMMHQPSRAERRAADVLLAMVLYSHFRSEHLLVHHPHVATPNDPVTARRGEGFWRFLLRVLWQCPASAFRAEAARLARRGKSRFARQNPFWRYGALQGLALALAAALGGWPGLGLFLGQALVAVISLELVNYIEHYGLTRARRPDGRYEPVQPHHSWNAAHRASNWLLINLQRHSDHHARPDRRFALLQNHPARRAPQLPRGYPLMAMAAMVPPLWRRIMDPRVEAWQARFYPASANGADQAQRP